MKTISLRIEGKVQGVFYRKSTAHEANKLGITGQVWNEDDGSVGVIATGEDALLEKLVQWCHQGPPRAQVEKVDVTEVKWQEFDGFTTRR